MKGVLDRFEGNLAVILLEDEAKEFTTEKESLPKGSVVGTWFHITHNQSNYAISSIDIAETEAKSAANALLLEQLRDRKKTSKFKRG